MSELEYAPLHLEQAQILAQILFRESSSFKDYRYESAQQINALLQTVKNLEFEVEQYKKRLVASDAKSEVLRAERDAALAVVNEFISDTTFENQTPDHECEFRYSPETGKCDACEAWGNYVGLFCSRTDEEETQ
jgi:hypothetical protein